MEAGTTSDSHRSGEEHRLLSDERLVRVGALVAPLVSDGLAWIERRKETVTLLDDRALRRHITVDFSLRSTVQPLLEPSEENVEGLYCAPIFVLPKSPSNLSAFDLIDESGNALMLISREDNARISAETLVTMVRSSGGGRELPADLERELRRVAQWEALRAEPIAKRLADPSGPWQQELAAFRADQRLVGWLRTLAHSSIVVVLFRSTGPRRKLVKLTFEEPISTEQKRLTRLGWAPYKVMIDSPRIEARTFHFEAEAPSGLRISQARLTDTERDEPVVETGFMKRVHLYRQSAAKAGAGTADLLLNVSTSGFVAGAMLASSLTLLALTACAIRAPDIASNPTSAPALLLVLPGLIASYSARSDRHALTTRLLSSARMLVLGIAFCAYTAAARVGLSGVAASDEKAVAAEGSSLQCWLWILTAITFVLFLALAVTWLRGSKLRPFLSQYRFQSSRGVKVEASRLDSMLSGLGQSNCPLPANYSILDTSSEGPVVMTRSSWHGDWTLALSVEAIADCSLVSVTLDYVNLLPTGVALPFLRRREAGRIVEYLEQLERWGDEQSAT